MSRLPAAVVFGLCILCGSAVPATASNATFEPQSGPVGTTITVFGICDQPGLDQEAGIVLNISRSTLGEFGVPPPVNVPWTFSFKAPEGVRVGSSITIRIACGGPAGSELIGQGFFEITETPPIPEPVATEATFTG